ncbi:MAG: RsmB/NOP family class I SAM-dependent RNA methyltransferase [Candidatus Kapaibacterium sp.]
MSISDHICRELANAALEVVSQGRFANSVVQKKFRANDHWDAEEKSFFAESLYFIVRNARRLCVTMGVTGCDTVADSLKLVQGMLILHSLHVPKYLHVQNRVDTAAVQRRWTDAGSTRVVAYSLPDWLDDMGSALFGAAWDSMVHALHTEPKVVLRANALKITREELERRLRDRDISCSPSPLSDTSVVLARHHNVFTLQEFRDGLFEVQDAGSQCIAPFCAVEPGMRVIDACAGSGGKALHLSALMKNKGRVIAMDTEEWKLTALAQRARLAGVSIIETRTITSTKVVKRQHASADRVLLDVPCSGLGVLRRNPDTKWHITASDIDRFVTMQRDILRQYSAMVAPGGAVIYATCSILPAECEEQVRWFLAQTTGWTLEEERRIEPGKHDADGFYMARLRRDGTPETAR